MESLDVQQLCDDIINQIVDDIPFDSPESNAKEKEVEDDKQDIASESSPVSSHQQTRQHEEPTGLVLVQTIDDIFLDIADPNAENNVSSLVSDQNAEEGDDEPDATPKEIELGDAPNSFVSHNEDRTAIPVDKRQVAQSMMHSEMQMVENSSQEDIGHDTILIDPPTEPTTFNSTQVSFFNVVCTLQ